MVQKGDKFKIIQTLNGEKTYEADATVNVVFEKIFKVNFMINGNILTSETFYIDSLKSIGSHSRFEYKLEPIDEA